MAIKYTKAVGAKFHPDGSVRTFPGNTVISFVPADSHIYREAVWAQNQLRPLPFAHKFGFLPPSSFHMTVFELLCDQVRRSERWSAQLPLDMTLGETDTFFINTVPPVPRPASLRMHYAYLDPISCALYLEAADVETTNALRRYREQLAQATGIRFPDHDRYQFHISLAYRLIELSDEEQTELDALLARLDQRLQQSFGLFEAPPPTLTFFDDMFDFVRVDQRNRLITR